MEPGAGLTYAERSEVKAGTKPGARVVYEIIRTEGESELRRPYSVLFGLTHIVAGTAEAAYGVMLRHGGSGSIARRPTQR